MSLIMHIENLGEEGIEINEEFERGWLSNMPEYTRDNDLGFVKDRIRIGGSLIKEGNNLHLRGLVQLKIHTLCSRCGEDMDYQMDSSFDLVLMPGTDRVAGEDEKLSPEDFSHIYYQGPELDLTPYFQEQIALEIPIQFLCRRECQGICGGCGRNLNRETCECPKPEGDPRLAALRKLKVGK